MLMGPALVVPLVKVATLSWRFVEAPDRLNIIRKAIVRLSTDGVIETCCRMITAAFRCLAMDRHTMAEYDIHYRRV